VLEKKARLGVDEWGGTDTHIRHVMQPLEELFAQEFPDYQPFPFGINWMLNRVVRNILLAEPLLEEFAELFKGLNEQDIDALMQSFLFKNCHQRADLAEILTVNRE
jgi:hypothetical protein